MLYEPVQLGRLQLRNRVVMAPMTRGRAREGDMPCDIMIEYYRQRASAGMIVTEGVAPSADGIGYCNTPGIYNAEQTAVWSRIVDAVHEEGGTIVAQLMHCGRFASHHNKMPDSETVAPSAIQAQGEIFTYKVGMAPLDMPRALETDEIAGVVDDYRRATANAYEAGFDGVELHCTSGYLPVQFLSTGTNQRTDQYGGELANRVRFPLEVLCAISEVDGPGRVGFRICPDNPYNDLYDDDPQETFAAFLAGASELKLAYCHTIRLPDGRVDNFALSRQHFPGQVIGNDSFSRDEAQAAIEAGELAAVSFGRPYISNPDLVERFKHGWPLADFDLSTMYSPEEKGYTDYETYSS